jgi:hypothetical protein
MPVTDWDHAPFFPTQIIRFLGALQSGDCPGLAAGMKANFDLQNHFAGA